MWFQSPEYLKWTRSFLLSPRNRGRVVSLLNIENCKSVLDVGCGSGEFTRYIAVNDDCAFIGLDREPELIDYASQQRDKNISYVMADALKMPFSDGSFDLVVSHSFLTSVSDPTSAMKEMRRVCKKDGVIASLTPETFTYVPFSSGHYKNATWINEFRSLKEKLNRLYIEEAKKYVKGVKPEEIPFFFYCLGLECVHVDQIGQFFSLSDAAIDYEEKKNYLNLEIDAEKTRLYLLDTTEQNRYMELLELRKRFLLTQNMNAWEWVGGSALMVLGINR